MRLLWDLFNSKAFKKGGENPNGDKAEIAFPNRPSCTSYTDISTAFGTKPKFALPEETTYKVTSLVLEYTMRNDT